MPIQRPLETAKKKYKSHSDIVFFFGFSRRKTLPHKKCLLHWNLRTMPLKAGQIWPITKKNGAINIADGQVLLTAADDVSAVRLSNIASPQDDGVIVTKGYEEDKVSGLTIKGPCRVAKVDAIDQHPEDYFGNDGTNPINVTVDGVSIDSGDRILVTTASDPRHNGIWFVAYFTTGAATKATCSTDMAALSAASGC